MILLGGVVLVWLLSNGVGLMWTYAILYRPSLQARRIQPHSARLRDFHERIPLVALNLLVLLSVVLIAVWLDGALLSMKWKGWVPFAAQFFILLFVDDLYFYLFHRSLHRASFLYRKIHYVHHRAHAPLPLDYIYVHPLEWMLGALGTVAGIVVVYFALHEINGWAFLAFNCQRNLREIFIHSGFRSSIARLVPLLAPNDHHDLHHSKLRGNYASTLTLWDHVFGTTIPSEPGVKGFITPRPIRTSPTNS